MKNLILITLTLISLNSIGQTRPNEDIYCHWPTSEEIIELRMLNDMLPLVNAWDKYSTECYNDSALVSVPYFCSMVGCLVYHSNVNEMRHKQPTFPDFMEWLKTKYEL